MLRLGIRFKQLLLVTGDLIIFQVALLLTLLLRYGHVEQRYWDLHEIPFGVVSTLWIVGSYVEGLYDFNVLKNGIKFFRLYLEGMIANLAVALAFFYLIPIFGIEPRTNLFLYFAIVLLLGYGWRLGYNRLIAHTLFRNRVLFIGSGMDAAKIRTMLERSAFGFHLVAVFETTPNSRFEDPEVAWYSSLGDIEKIIRERDIHTILLGHKPDDIPGLRDALYKTLFLPVTLLDRTALEETITGRIPLEYVSQTWFLEHLRENEKAWYEMAKRIGDILMAIPFGIITLILYPIVALIIKVSSPGPALYSQIRLGKFGKQFRIWKFRTMHVNAEENGPQFTADAKTDPRLFAAGRVLRRLRLDEFPQIWNVLRGNLSFIGPRPERPEFVEQLTERMPYYSLRHLTRPGLTGWAQVRFLTPTASLEDNLKKLQYDVYYIKHRSPLLDIAILLKTIAIVIRRQGT